MITPMQAKDYTDENPVGMWMSEKFDGVRAIWDGTKFLSKQGNILPVPDYLTENMPTEALDGEIVMEEGCGGFQRVLELMADKTEDGWRDALYMVFDAPTIEGGWRKRHGFVNDMEVYDYNPWVVAVDQTPCRSVYDLDEFFNLIVNRGGEGVMLAKPNMSYVAGRTRNILKLKPRQDAEAKVIGHDAGEGRNKEKLGALICKRGKVVFRIGTGFSDYDRANPPAIDSEVTFTYYGLTEAGKPRHASFKAVRNYE